MKLIAEAELAAHPITDLVRYQLARVYHETHYVVVGTLGRTTLMGGVPDYWHRPHGNLRDIDVHDPQGMTTEEAYGQLDNKPLSIDRSPRRWLHTDSTGATLVFPFDNNIRIPLPISHLDVVIGELLRVPVRTYRPEVMLGLNIMLPYDRMRQRTAISRFSEWVMSRADFDKSMLEPYEEFQRLIQSEHPEFVRKLRRRDVAAQLPTPMYKALLGLYRVSKRKNSSRR